MIPFSKLAHWRMGVELAEDALLSRGAGDLPPSLHSSLCHLGLYSPLSLGLFPYLWGLVSYRDLLGRDLCGSMLAHDSCFPPSSILLHWIFRHSFGEWVNVPGPPWAELWGMRGPEKGEESLSLLCLMSPSRIPKTNLPLTRYSKIWMLIKMDRSPLMNL